MININMIQTLKNYQRDKTIHKHLSESNLPDNLWHIVLQSDFLQPAKDLLVLLCLVSHQHNRVSHATGDLLHVGTLQGLHLFGLSAGLDILPKPLKCLHLRVGDEMLDNITKWQAFQEFTALWWSTEACYKLSLQ